MTIEPGYCEITIDRNATYEENFTLSGEGWDFTSYTDIILQARHSSVKADRAQNPPLPILECSISNGKISAVTESFTVKLSAAETKVLTFDICEFGIVLVTGTGDTAVKLPAIIGKITVNGALVI